MFLTRAGGRTVRQLAIVAVAVGTGFAVAGAIDLAFAQGTPFGAPKGAPPTPPATGVVGWIMTKQAEFYKGLTGAIRAAKTDNAALWLLFGLSFGYGIFHAAGPGHGKAVISSYVVANRETWWRGVVLSFASAMVQAAVAVALVTIAAVLLNATAATMRRTTDIIEVASYSFIMAIGARLFCVKGLAFVASILGRAPTAMEKAVASLVEALLYIVVIEIAAVSLVTLLQPSLLIGAIAFQLIGAFALWLLWRSGSSVIAAWRARTAASATAHHDHVHHDHAHHGHEHHDHAHQDHAHHDHSHAHDPHHGHDHAHHDHSHHGHGHGHHDHASAWGHAHAPEPQELAGPGGWKRGLSATIAVGLRPCSGAILVLVFTLSQGLFWAGVVSTFVMGLGTAITVAAIAVLSVLAAGWAERFASTRGGYGIMLMRGIEVGAALLITAFGALLLMGYMASERLFV